MAKKYYRPYGKGYLSAIQCFQRESVHKRNYLIKKWFNEIELPAAKTFRSN